VVQLEDTVSSKELTSQRLRAQLEETVLREERRAARDQEIYGLIQKQVGEGRRAVAAVAAGKKLGAVDVVRIYEAKREADEGHIRSLENQLQHKKAEVEDMSNSLACKEKGGGWWWTPSECTMMKIKSESDKVAEEARRQLAKARREAGLEARAAALKLRQVEERVAELAEQNAGLIMEVNTLRAGARDDD
jgi:hypothetical protein